jgi:large subunit ribosomal protein L25
MTETITLEAQPRDRAGKGAARATRRAGRVPAVIYGGKKSPLSISLDPKVLSHEMHRPGFFSHLFDITVDGHKHRALAREVQLHPVTDEALHVDFIRVTATTRTHVEIPVMFHNHDASPGLKRGGVLNIVAHDVGLNCRADAIPEHLDVDLTGLDIGDSIHISAIKLPEGTSPTITDRDFTVATIVPPTVEVASETDAEAAEAAAATPAEET